MNRVPATLTSPPLTISPPLIPPPLKTHTLSSPTPLPNHVISSPLITHHPLLPPVAMNRVPATLTAGVKKFFCGPESFTPDLAPIVGEAPEIR